MSLVGCVGGTGKSNIYVSHPPDQRLLRAIPPTHTLSSSDIPAISTFYILGCLIKCVAAASAGGSVRTMCVIVVRVSVDSVRGMGDGVIG